MISAEHDYLKLTICSYFAVMAPRCGNFLLVVGDDRIQGWSSHEVESRFRVTSLVVLGSTMDTLGVMIDAKLVEDGRRNIKTVLVIGMLYDISFRFGIPNDATYLKMCPEPDMNLLFNVISTFDRMLKSVE